MTCTRTYYITVDSRHRDRSLWTKTSKFEVKMDPLSGFAGAAIQRSFKNVVSIELVDAIYPFVDSCSYLFLKIHEIDGNLLTTCNGNQYFTKLVPKTIMNGFVYSNADFNNDVNKRTFLNRGTRIDKLTLEIIKPDGETIDFGNDTMDDPVPALQTCFTFKIVIEDVQRD